MASFLLTAFFVILGCLAFILVVFFVLLNAAVKLPDRPPEFYEEYSDDV